MTNNIVVFGKAKTEPATELAVIASASVPPPEKDRLQLSIDTLIKMLEDNRHQIESFMGLMTFKTNEHGAAGLQIFTSPMDLANFSLGVRVLDGAANSMLHGR